MTTIKYVDSQGKKATVRCWQGSRDTLASNVKRGPTVAEADAHMQKLGFQRAGSRQRRGRRA